MDFSHTDEFLVVEGGAKLNGEVQTSGAKNSILKQMAAALLLGNGTSTIKNVPNLTDIDNMAEIIRFLGGTVERSEGEIFIDARDLSTNYVPFELASKLRASFVVLGALVGRFGDAKVSLPGGCKIGARRLDLHLKGLKALGAEISEDQGYVIAETEKLIGTKIYLDIPSNGATENIMIAACLAEGETVIENAAKDPEIVDLACFLNQMGFEITGAGTSNIYIRGKKQSELKSVEHVTIPDRVEAATYMIASLITQGDVIVRGLVEEDLHSILSKFEEIGASIKIFESAKQTSEFFKLSDIQLSITEDRLKPTDITTVWYPGFPTDVQPQMTALLCLSDGVSTITETIYESRFQHAEELKRMGADITVNGKMALIKGVERLSGANLTGTDLRNTAALVIAALAADGTSQVRGLEYLDRGYEDLEAKFNSLGAKITRSRAGEILNSTMSSEELSRS